MTVVDSASRHTNTLGTASLRGRVRLADGKPAKSVIVAVGGTSRSTRTDSVGAFLLAGVPAGTRTIEVRGVGAVPFTTTVHLATNEMRDTTLQLQRVAQELKAVEVKGKAGLSSLMKQSGFEDRRRMGLGAFLTDSDLAKHEYPDLRSVLAVARGIRLEYGPGGSAMPYMRNASGLCIPTFFLDGAHFPVDGPVPPSRYPFSDLSDLVRPERIRGIEVYSSLGTIPLEYDRNAVGTCGAVVIWTR